MQRLSLFAENEIKLQNLPPDIRNHDPMGLLVQACDRCFHKKSMTFDQVITCLERNLLAEALQKSQCNQSEAARNLGMSLSTFRDKIKKHSIDCENLSGVFTNLR
jgi:DNA-binding NtrC family response regulator